MWKTIFVQSTGNGPVRDAEHGDLAAHDDRVEHLVQRRLRPAHLKPDVEALAHAEPLHDGSQVFLPRR